MRLDKAEIALIGKDSGLIRSVMEHYQFPKVKHSHFLSKAKTERVERNCIDTGRLINRMAIDSISERTQKPPLALAKSGSNICKKFNF